MGFIPYGRQEVTKDDIDAVVDVLRSDFLTQGPVVSLFEKAVSEYVGAKYSVAVNSATSALHISCLSLGLTSGDILWTSPITFAASANCALYCGAKVDFVDINPETFNISIEHLDLKLCEANKQNSLPKIFVAVHFGGQSCEMDKIYKLCSKYGVSVIEDASHAIGGEYRGQKIGSCKYSDITIFSFHPVKIITSAEGGIAVTNNSKLTEKLFLFRSHGITRDPQMLENRDEGPWYYEQLELGFNYRMSDVLAALGLSQLDNLDKYVQSRNKLAKKYQEEFKGFPLCFQKNIEQCYSAYHLMVIQLDIDRLKLSRRAIFEGLRHKNIGVNVHYIPVYHLPFYQKMGFKKGYLENAEKYYARALTLPMYPSLTDDQFFYIKDTISNLLG